MKLKPKPKRFVPFPIGTVRGPYRDHGWVQFLVRGKKGWVPFIRKQHNEKECRQAAENYAKEITNARK